METPAPDPTTFEWWSGIIVPSIVGVLSLLLAGLSLWIAIRAQITANRALATAVREATLGRRTARGEFAAKVRKLEAITSRLTLPISEEDYLTVYELHRDLHAEAIALAQPTAIELVWYAALVHDRPDRRREASAKTPRDRPSYDPNRTFPAPSDWQSYAKLEGRWIEDPEEPLEAIRAQGLALTGDAGVVFNIKQWNWPWI